MGRGQGVGVRRLRPCGGRVAYAASHAPPSAGAARPEAPCPRVAAPRRSSRRPARWPMPAARVRADGGTWPSRRRFCRSRAHMVMWRCRSAGPRSKITHRFALTLYRGRETHTGHPLLQRSSDLKTIFTRYSQRHTLTHPRPQKPRSAMRPHMCAKCK